MRLDFWGVSAEISREQRNIRKKIFLIFWTGCSKRKFVFFFFFKVIFEISLKVYSEK